MPGSKRYEDIAGSGKLRVTTRSDVTRASQQTDDPRRAQTGTSLATQGKGTISPGVTVMTEKGSSRGGTIRDIVPALGNRNQRVITFEEMANGDAAVDVSLRAAKTPVMGADYFVEPFDDTPENIEIAEFVHFNLLEGSNSPFLMTLEDVLRMYEYEFSVLEKVWEEREWAPKRNRANRRKYTMLRKLAPRPTPTITEIMYDDNGGPTGIKQQAMRKDGKPEEIEIPIEKLIIFSNNRKGGNLEGKSMLRTAYRSWFFKINLYNIDGIQKERHGMGFPTIELKPNYTDAEQEAALELVSNIRTNERGGAVLPPGWILKFLELPGQPVDVLRSIEHHDGQIMLNTMTQFLLLGLEGSGGGRATSGAQQDMFNKSLRYVGNQICSSFNLYCIPYLVGYNFPTDKFPKLRVRNIGETKDLQQWASGVANLAAQELITPDIETEQWIRTIIDAPFKRGGVQTPKISQANAQKGNVKPGAPEQAPDTAPPDDAEA
jgi:hypothetical protein